MQGLIAASKHQFLCFKACSPQTLAEVPFVRLSLAGSPTPRLMTCMQQGLFLVEPQSWGIARGFEIFPLKLTVALAQAHPRHPRPENSTPAPRVMIWQACSDQGAEEGVVCSTGALVKPSSKQGQAVSARVSQPMA